MSRPLQQLCSQADEDLKISMLDHSFVPTFGKLKLPNRKIPVDDQAAPYYRLCAREPCSECLRKIYVLLARYPIDYSESMDEATRNANFLEFCSLAQAFQYNYDEFKEWEREIALEKHVLDQRQMLDDESFFGWVKTHDQNEIEYKLARNRAVLDNLDPEKAKETQEHMDRRYRIHEQQVEAEEKRKDFQCTIEAQVQPAGNLRQFAKVEDQKGSSKTVKPRIESQNSMKRKEAENLTRNFEENESPKGRSIEEIQQEFSEKVRMAATKCSKSTPLVPTSTRDPIAPSVPATAAPPLSLPAVPLLSKSCVSARASLSTSLIPPRTSAGPPSPSRSLSETPSSEGASRDSPSSGPAFPHLLSTPGTTPPSKQHISPPKAPLAITPPSKPAAEPASSASAMPVHNPVYDSHSEPRSRPSPLSIASAAPPQPPPFTQYTAPRRRLNPPEWVYPLSLLAHVISHMPYVPVEDSEAMMPPTETVLMLPHTAIYRTLAAAMHVHPSLLFQQCPLPHHEGRPREADAKDIEYLMFGLRAWWMAIFPKPTTREAAFARMSERRQFEGPLREAFDMVEKRAIKVMAKMVWGLVKKRGPNVSLTPGAGETIREWLGWERGELGFWD